MIDLKAPFPWFGGKSRVAEEVWARFGDVPNYVEPFAGSLAVLLGRPHAPKTETVNDKDALLANFWRAISHDAEAVAAWADYPINEADLHARHVWLLRRLEDLRPHVEGEPEWYDAQAAGWWVWGICSWIGSGWCSGNGPWWTNADGLFVDARAEGFSPDEEDEEDRQLPHLGNAGQGVNRKRPHLGNAGQGVNRKLPHLGNAGQGVNRKLPHLGDAGRGVNRKLPHLGNAGRGVNRKLLDWFLDLQDRLRRVRVCCGDWRRVCGPSVTIKHGLTGMLLDPPYSTEANRDMGCYAVDSGTVAHEVREWCIEHGSDPLLRIALCGYEGEHDELEGLGWSVHDWKAHGGMGCQGHTTGRDNAHRERIWFSPACIQETRAEQGVLFA